MTAPKKEEKKHAEVVQHPSSSKSHAVHPQSDAPRSGASSDGPRNPLGSDVVAQRLHDAEKEQHKKMKAAAGHSYIPSVSFRLAHEPPKQEVPHPVHPTPSHTSAAPTPKASPPQPVPPPIHVSSSPSSATSPAPREKLVPLWRRIAAWGLIAALLILFFYSNYTHNTRLDQYRAANQDFNSVNVEQETQIADLTAKLAQATADVESFKQASASLEGSKGSLEDQLRAANLKVAALQGEVRLSKDAIAAQVAKDKTLMDANVNLTHIECNTHVIDLYNATEKACVKLNPDKVARDLRTNLSGEVDVEGYLFK